MAEPLDLSAFPMRARMVLREHLEARIEVLRRKNENPLEPLETSAVRGRIAESRRLLAELNQTEIRVPDEYL